MRHKRPPDRATESYRNSVLFGAHIALTHDKIYSPDGLQVIISCVTRTTEKVALY